jgi:hypothetical protein
MVKKKDEYDEISDAHLKSTNDTEQTIDVHQSKILFGMSQLSHLTELLYLSYSMVQIAF